MVGLLTVGYFLFALLFSLLGFVLWARIGLRYFRISAIHPVSHLILTITNPIVLPLAHHFPIQTTRKSPYDWPCFCVLVMVELLKFIAIGSLFLGVTLPWTFLPIYTLADLIIQPCNLLFYAMLIQVIMSYVNPHWQHPAADVLRLITEPLYRLGRRIIPDISGFDFSPFLMMIILKIITLFIRSYLPLHLI